MKPSPLRALLWKDFRQNRLVLTVVFVMLLLGSLNVIVSFGRDGYCIRRGSVNALQILLIMSGLLVAVLSGSFVAADWTDRSAAFLAYMPPSGKTVVLSKALGAACAVGFVCLVNIVLFGLMVGLDYCSQRASDPSGFRPCFSWADIIRLAAVVAVPLLLVFGTAWLAGAFTGSPAIASCIGIASGVGLFVAFFVSMSQPGSPNSRLERAIMITAIYPAVSVALGIGCFLAGCLYAIHRKVNT